MNCYFEAILGACHEDFSNLDDNTLTEFAELSQTLINYLVQRDKLTESCKLYINQQIDEFAKSNNLNVVTLKLLFYTLLDVIIDKFIRAKNLIERIAPIISTSSDILKYYMNDENVTKEVTEFATSLSEEYLKDNDFTVTTIIKSACIFSKVLFNKYNIPYDIGTDLVFACIISYLKTKI